MLITHLNYAAALRQSSQLAGSPTPDGNVYFDKENNLIYLITADDAPFIQDPGSPSGLIANPLTAFDGITMRALYNFENQERRIDETLRKYKRGTDGDYRFAGAFSFVNGVKLAGTGRELIRGSGFIEYANSGDGQTNVDRIYHGVLSLVDIQATTVPYWALVTATDEATLQAATWTDFVRAGDINEVVQVFGSTTNGDTGAGNFDYTARQLVVRVRSWGYNPGQTTSVESGISEFSGFSGGYGVGESINPSNTYLLDQVYDPGSPGNQSSPWTGMSLEYKQTPQVETGFNEANGNFTWVLHNTLAGTVQECAAFLDAMTLQDSQIDVGSPTISYNGRKGRVWYTRNAEGLVVTASLGGAGLFIEGLSVAEKQNVIMTDDAGAEKTYPYFPEIQITVGAAAIADVLAWYHVFYATGGAGSPTEDFDTANAIAVNDSDGNPVKGNVSADQVGGKVSFAYAYDTNTQAGLAAGVDKDMVVVVEGDGGAAQAITYFTVTRTATIPVTCSPPADNNA